MTSGIPEALLHQVLAAVSSDAKIDAGVASQVKAYLAPGNELPRAFVQSAGTSATSSSSSSDPGAGIIAAASIASVVVVGAAVAALQQHRKAAEVRCRWATSWRSRRSRAERYKQLWRRADTCDGLAKARNKGKMLLVDVP